QLAHTLRLDARADIDAAPGGEGNDERDRPRGPILRGGVTAERDHGCRGGDHPAHARLLARAGHSRPAPTGSRPSLSRWHYRRGAEFTSALGALRTWTRDAFDRLRRNRPEADMGSITIPQCGGL